MEQRYSIAQQIVLSHGKIFLNPILVQEGWFASQVYQSVKQVDTKENRSPCHLIACKRPLPCKNPDINLHLFVSKWFSNTQALPVILVVLNG